ncbi:MAG: hypothetical protein QXK06_03700 [Candidatus Diapherotrites archaeon]
MSVFFSLFFGFFLVAQAFESTALNADFLKAKATDFNAYQVFFELSAENNGLSAKELIEFVGPNAIKAFGDGFVDAIVHYLREPKAKEIELGLPAVFSQKASFSVSSVLPQQLLSFFGKAKVAIQTMLVAKSMSLLLALVFLLVILIVASGVNSKMKWAGFSFALSGFLVLVFYLATPQIFFGFLQKTLSENNLNALLPFAQSVVTGFFSLSALWGVSFLFFGIILFAISLFFSSQRKNQRALEKKEIAEKRAEAEEREKLKRL